MILYNEKKKSLIVDESKFFDCGGCSRIVHFNDEKCLKVYYDETPPACRIKPDIYYDLKILHDDYLVEIYQLFYDENLYQVTGYLMKYYKEERLKILNMEVEYTLYIMDKLMQLFDKISSKNIIVDDLKRESIIYNNEKIILVDPDMFFRSDLSVISCKISNYEQLITLFKNIYRFEIVQFLELDYRVNPYGILDNIFCIEPNEQMVKSLSKKLAKYKYPRDYFLDQK